MDKKYTIGLSISHDGNREMNIETNDLQDLFQADWFKQFLMSKTYAPAQQIPVQSQVRDDTADLQLQLATDEINQLQKQLAQMRSQQQQMQQQLQQAQVQAQQDRPTPKFDSTIQAIMPDVQQQLQQQKAQQQAQQQPQPMSSPPRSPQPRRLPSSFLELNPDNMTEAIWNSLTAEQQQQWLAYYKIA